jgi:hypothetical protein
LNETDLYIVGAAMAGVIKPDDLGRPGRYLSHFVRAAVIYEPNGLGTEQQLNLACEEVLAFHQAGVRNTADLQRQFQALQRAREQHDPRRVRQLSERYDRHHNRAYAEMQTLAAALRAKLSNVAGLSHGNNP